jgi:hypothetical protein
VDFAAAANVYGTNGFEDSEYRGWGDDAQRILQNVPRAVLGDGYAKTFNIQRDDLMIRIGNFKF